MKKVFLSFVLLFLLSEAYSQSYEAELKRINIFLKTFDNGYYGHLAITDGTLYDYYKSGTYSKIKIDDFSIAKVVETNRKVGIFCNNKTRCVLDNSGNAFDEMPFSTQSDFNAAQFAESLNTLIARYKETGREPSHLSSQTNEVVPAAFPAGCQVKVIKEEKPFSLLEAIAEEEGKKEVVTGTVIADLKPLGDGWYSGSIKLSYGTIRKFEKAMFEIVK